MNLNMMKQALEMRSRLEKAQKELAKKTVEAEAGKGAVRVVVNGQQKIISIKIAPEVIDPQRAGELEKLVLKAMGDALEESQKIAAKELKDLTGGLKIPGLT